MILFTFCTLILISNILANPVSDDNDFQEYIKDIKSHIDNTIKPCEDFGKYACGKLIEKKPFDMNELIEKELKNNDKLQTDDAKLIKTIYSSCKNVDDITKIFGYVDEFKSETTWPVTRDYSKHEIAKFFGYLATTDVSGLFGMEFSDLREKNLISIELNPKGFNEEVLRITLEKFGSTTEQSIKIVQDITKLIEQIQNVRTNDKDDKLNNVAALIETVPNFDWDTYFTTFTKQFSFDVKEFIKKPVKVHDLAKLKKIIDIISTTDSKTVVNYLMWRLIKLGLGFNCIKLVPILYPLLATQDINEKSNYNKFFLNELEIFNHLEKSFSELKSNFNNADSIRLNKYLKFKRSVHENYEKFLSGTFFTNLCSGYEFNEKTMYKNLLNTMQILMKNIIIDGAYGNYYAFMDFISSSVTKYLKAGKHIEPTLQNFIRDNVMFWTKTNFLGNIYDNFTYDNACFPFEKKIDNYANVYYINTHATYHVSMQDYLHFIEQHKEEFKKETQILMESELNHDKAFMLALAQEKCSRYQEKKLDNEDQLLWFFKHSKQFSDIWGCSANDAMYKVCDDSTFVADFKISS